MKVVNSKFEIKKKYETRVLEAVRSLNCGTWIGADSVKNCSSLKGIMRCWRWNISCSNPDFDFDRIAFIGEKFGDDVTLFQAIAPYVTAGSFIEMQGEDGGRWRWAFDGTNCHEDCPKSEWPVHEPVVKGIYRFAVNIDVESTSLEEAYIKLNQTMKKVDSDSFYWESSDEAYLPHGERVGKHVLQEARTKG